MRVVFHLSTGDTDEQAHALTNVSNLLADETVDHDHVVVVANAEAVEMLTHGTANDSRVEHLLEEGVSFRVCSNALRVQDVDSEALLDGVETVSSAVGELARLQEDGYGYIRP